MKGYLFILMVVGLGGCALNTAPIAPTARPLLAASAAGERLSTTQQVSIVRPAQKQQLLFELELDASQLSVVGLDGFSNPLFAITYDGQAIATQRFVPMAADDAFAAFLLADVQLVHWPLSALEPVYQAAGLRLEQRACSQARWCRFVYRDAELVAEVGYQHKDIWQGPIYLIDYQQGYRLTVDSLSLERK